MFTMTPPSAWWRMARPAATEQWIMPNRCVPSVNSQSSAVRSRTGPRRSAPALVIMTSRRPKCSKALSTMAAAPGGVATESGLAAARPPAATISSTTLAADPASTSFTTTAAPSRLYANA